MENNQQRGGEKNTSNAAGARTFDNEQPGQLVPMNSYKEDAAEPASGEAHSDNSLPEKDNETLGTP